MPDVPEMHYQDITLLIIFELLISQNRCASQWFSTFMLSKFHRSRVHHGAESMRAVRRSMMTGAESRLIIVLSSDRKQKERMGTLGTGCNPKGYPQ